jgi:hypothetical protein
MSSLQESLSYWTTILGTIAAFFGVIQSVNWLAGTGAIFLAGSILALAYGNRQRKLLNMASLRVEGRSIDSLNVANLRRRVNESLIVQEVHNTAVICGEDLSIRWHCVGFCQAENESSIEFSIDADNGIPFADLECFAYDLHNDPDRRHKIRPLLVGPEGISKKISVPFLAPVQNHQPFAIELICTLRRCMKEGLDYYTATLSFAQDRVNRYTVELVFEGDFPDWVRLYECEPSGSCKLVRDLAPRETDYRRVVYEDTAEDISAQTARAYFFHRRPSSSQ